MERELLLGAMDYQEDPMRQQTGRDGRGRVPRDIENCKEMGKQMRLKFRDAFNREGMKRPAHSNGRG